MGTIFRAACVHGWLYKNNVVPHSIKKLWAFYKILFMYMYRLVKWWSPLNGPIKLHVQASTSLVDSWESTDSTCTSPPSSLSSSSANTENGFPSTVLNDAFIAIKLAQAEDSPVTSTFLWKYSNYNHCTFPTKKKTFMFVKMTH